MIFPDRNTVEQIRRDYPTGCKVELIHMDDPLSIIRDNGSYQYF